MPFTDNYKPFGGRDKKRKNIMGIPDEEEEELRFPTPLQALVIRDLNNGKSPNIAFVGDTGDGKSMKALKFVEDMYNMGIFDDDFPIDENLVYSARGFLDILVEQDTPSVGGDDVKHDREAIIFDEAGVELNISQYNNANNTNIDKTLQVARAWNNLYIFIAPKIKDMDARLQGRLDYVVNVWGQGKATTYKVIDVADKMDGKTIFKVKLSHWYPDLPSDESIKEYQEVEYEKKSETINEMKDTLEEDDEDFSASSLY